MATGAIAGIPIGVVVATNFLPIDIGDGWANISGAALGVIGAFWIANHSFNRNLKARDFERRQPIVKRYAYCLSELNKIVRNASILGLTLNRIIFDESSANKEIIDTFPDDYRLVNITGKTDISQKITKSFRNITEELKWLFANKTETLSPHELAHIKDALESLENAKESFVFQHFKWSTKTKRDITDTARINPRKFFTAILRAYNSISEVRILH